MRLGFYSDEPLGAARVESDRQRLEERHAARGRGIPRRTDLVRHPHSRLWHHQEGQSQKFEHLLDAYRRPDGSRWTGQQLYEATGGVVTRSYFTNLRKGRITNPGYEKLAAIAKAMGFPPEAWFEEGVSGEPVARNDGRGVAGRVEHLFDAVRNPKTGEPYTNAEVARMTLGNLSEEEVERIRTGAIGDATVGQAVALAGVFGVEPSYLCRCSTGSLWRLCGTVRFGRQPARFRACTRRRGGWYWGSCGSSEAKTILVLPRMQKELLGRRAQGCTFTRRPGSRYP